MDIPPLERQVAADTLVTRRQQHAPDTPSYTDQTNTVHAALTVDAIEVEHEQSNITVQNIRARPRSFSHDRTNEPPTGILVHHARPIPEPTREPPFTIDHYQSPRIDIQQHLVASTFGSSNRGSRHHHRQGPQRQQIVIQNFNFGTSSVPNGIQDLLAALNPTRRQRQRAHRYQNRNT